MLCGISAGQNDDCGGNGWVEIQAFPPEKSLESKSLHHCVKEITEKTTWHRANAICIQENAHLLEIDSQYESHQVQDKVLSTSSSKIQKCNNSLCGKPKVHRFEARRSVKPMPRMILVCSHIFVRPLKAYRPFTNHYID